ncbi:MAG: hypothetical protein CL581_00175 [Alteromonadaceae bacterium]|nr:hypothetical protein [Alteromonadaceae bacterium]MBH84173.1 hypothetical protein [Alteromonadaceae bacterium]|tara:strand:- start:35482 stop:35955 length:474 start_codon:yes stop_codon:yes gene_type:complete
MTQPTAQPDPLANLRDIHLPDPGGFWPPAPGWWILAALVLVALICLAVFLRRRQQRNRWIKTARAELKMLKQRQSADPGWFTDLNALLKRCARQRYPDAHPQSLSGDRWRQFLLETQPALTPEEVQGLVASSWQPVPTISTETACKVAETWLGAQKC